MAQTPTPGGIPGFDPNAATANLQTFTAGSVFGLDSSIADYPLPANAVPGVPSSPFLLNGGLVPTPRTTVLGAMQDYAQFTPAEKRSLIAPRLLAAGYLEPKAGKVKSYSINSINDAYRQAVFDAAAAGVSVNELLDSSASAGGDGSDAAAKPPITYTSPTDLKYVFAQSAQKVLGYKLDDGTLQRMVDSFHGLEQTAGSAAQQGNDYTQPPNPTAFADQTIRSQNPAAAGANDYLSHADEFFSLLKGVAGGQ